jgi:CHAT domain-containing protein
MTRHGRDVIVRILAAGVGLVVVPQTLLAQSDPIELQNRAIERLEAFVETFRKTGDMRSRLPDLAQADAEFTASNRVLAARNDWSPLALGLIKQGHVYRMQGQWQAAAQFYTLAEEAARRGKDVVRQSDALSWRGLAQSSQHNLGQAIADATQAVRLAETTADKDVLAQALDVLGAAQVAQLDLAAAVDTLTREVAVAAEAKNPMASWFAFSNRSDVYTKTGEKCGYDRYNPQCLEAFDRARADLQQALAIARRLGYTFIAGQTEQFIRNVENHRTIVLGQQQSTQALEKADIFHPKRPGDVLVTNTFVAEPGIDPGVVQAFELAKRSSSQSAFGPVEDARSEYVEGAVNEMRGNNDAALAHFLKAVDLLDADRRLLRSERSRGTFGADRMEFYYAAVQQLLDHRRYADAFEVFERSRSRSLADLLASRALTLGQPDEQRLFAESATLRTKIADAQSRLFEVITPGDTAKASADVTSIQAEIRALEDQDAKIHARMASEAPRLESLVSAKPATLAALQRSMREEQYEVLQYLVAKPGVYVWHLTPDSVVVRNVFLPREELIKKVGLLQSSLADRNATFDQTTARELFLYLFQPIASGIGTNHLVIIPHEDLQYVPFEVLQDPADGRYLGERFQITTAPSASILLTLKRSTTLSGGRLLAVADPEIPAARREVTAIAQQFPSRSRVVIEPRASESDVKTWVRDYDVIHLSVHGKYDPAEPMLSYLLLGQGATDDGRLTAAEMFGLPLDKSRIVVLSACETGRAEATHGNEILGMLRGLLYAGAGTLVLSHWEVNSEATALWMQTFYEAAATRPVPEAARLALVKVKSNPAYSHPYFWAAFGVVGR